MIRVRQLAKPHDLDDTWLCSSPTARSRFVRPLSQAPNTSLIQRMRYRRNAIQDRFGRIAQLTPNVQHSTYRTPGSAT